MKLMILSGSTKLEQLVSMFLVDCFIRAESPAIAVNLEDLALDLCHRVFSPIGFMEPLYYYNNPNFKHQPFSDTKTTAFATACCMTGLVDGVNPSLWLKLMPDDNVIVHGVSSDRQAIAFVSAGFDTVLIPTDRQFVLGCYPTKWIVQPSDSPSAIWRECARIASAITGVEIKEPR